MVFVKYKSPALKPFGIAYLVPLVLYLIAFLPMLDMHDYYVLPAMPLLIIVGTIGFNTMLTWSSSVQWRRFLFVFLLVCLPVLGAVRGLSRFENARVRPDLLSIEKHLDKYLPSKTELVIVADDESPSTYLYFMHRKGWAVKHDIPSMEFRNQVACGAKYLISDSRTLEERADLGVSLALVSTYGQFRVFRLDSTGIN